MNRTAHLGYFASDSAKLRQVVRVLLASASLVLIVHLSELREVVEYFDKVRSNENRKNQLEAQLHKNYMCRYLHSAQEKM